MIPVSRGKPAIVFSKSSSDMDGWTPAQFLVRGSGWGWMELHEYMSKKEFEEFKLEPDEKLTKEQLEEITEVVQSGKELSFGDCILKPHLAYTRRMQLELKKSGGQLLWQYNVVNKNLDGWYRDMINLGGTHNYPDYRLRRITPFERYVKIPVLESICTILNKLLKLHNKKEFQKYTNFKKNLYECKGK